MKSKFFILPFIIFCIGFLGFLLLNENQEEEQENISSFTIAGKEFILPSPIHTFSFLEENGFQWEGLGLPKKNSDFTLKSQIALNLGIRASDGVIFVFAGEMLSAWDARRDVLLNAKKLDIENQIKKTISTLDRAVLFRANKTDLLERIIDIEISIENTLQKKGRDDLSLLIEMGSWIGGLEIVTRGIIKDFREVHTEVLHQSHISELSIEIFKEIIQKTKDQAEKDFLNQILSKLTIIHLKILALESRGTTKLDIQDINKDALELLNIIQTPK